MAANHPTVLVFLKAPRAGAVKTRLAAEVGARRALLVYRQLVARQLGALPPDWPVEIHYAPRGARAALRRWLGATRILRMQRGADLGARLANAFTGAFARGARRELAIGGDCPTLDVECFERAGQALLACDVVLGPARDGGYYLIGLRRPARGLFADIPWSTPAVLATTERRIRAARLTHTCLAVKEDVDDHASLRRNVKYLR